MFSKKIITILFILFISINIAKGQTTLELARKLANPVASMISIPFQNNLDVRVGINNSYKYVLNFQPVIPITLSKSLNLINRIIIPTVSQFSITSQGASQSGLSDIVMSNFFSPTQSKITWGLGPVFLIPTATNDFLGTKKFGTGPTGVLLKQSGSSTYGGLVNQIWSVAGDENRKDVNQLFVNPFYTYNFKSGAGMTLSIEYTRDWTNKLSYASVIPSISGITKFGSQTVSIAFAPRINIYQNNRPSYGIRGVFTFVFPK